MFPEERFIWVEGPQETHARRGVWRVLRGAFPLSYSPSADFSIGRKPDSLDGDGQVVVVPLGLAHLLHDGLRVYCNALDICAQAGEF